MKKVYIGVLFFFSVLLTGCLFEKENPVLSMYEHLEEAVQIERSVEELQLPLTEAEEKEMEYYSTMTELADLEELENVANQAIQSAEKRMELINEEKEKISQSYDEFQLAIPYIENIEMEDVKEKAETLVEIMEERYDTYEELHQHYIDSIEKDIELYEMIYKEDVTVEQLEEQLTLINELYNEINERNERFNDLTAKYNEMKKSFYEIAELNVKFD